MQTWTMRACKRVLPPGGPRDRSRTIAPPAVPLSCVLAELAARLVDDRTRGGALGRVDQQERDDDDDTLLRWCAVLAVAVGVVVFLAGIVVYVIEWSGRRS